MACPYCPWMLSKCQVSYVSEDALRFVKNALEIHEQFNLAQLLASLLCHLTVSRAA